jgi:protein-arginine kinase activator protein McsA
MDVTVTGQAEVEVTCPNCHLTFKDSVEVTVEGDVEFERQVNEGRS